VADQRDLEKLYREAQSALKAKDYARASNLLRQILKADVDYKDAAQLLARAIQLSRRRWYNDPRMWGALGVLLLIGLGIYSFPKLQGLISKPAPTIIILPTDTPAQTIISPATATATVTPLLTPTPIPLTWKRISLGQEFERDTVTAFATDKRDPDVIYAGMKNAGVYKTIDGGLSWRPAHQGLASTQVESLLIDSQNPQILYAGTMGGVFKTEDGGENWFRIGKGTYLLMDWQDNSHLYARDENGIYETMDQGNIWTTVYVLKKDCPDEIHSWAIHPADGNMLFIGGGESCTGVYQSSDSGHAWTLIGLEDIPNIDMLAMGFDEQENYSIYAINSRADNWDSREGYMYTTHDGGANWSHTSISGGCASLNSDPDNTSVIYCASSTALFVMQSKGDTWKTLPGTQSIVFSAIHIDHLNGTDRIISSGRTLARNQLRDRPGVGIFISVDGGASWVERDNGLGSARAELKIDPMDNAKIFLATYYAGKHVETNCTLYKSLYSGENWSSIKRGDWCGPAFDSTGVFYLIQSGSLQSSRDDGENWLWGYEIIGEYDQQEDTAEEAKRIANRLPMEAQSLSANPYIDGLIYAVGDAIFFSTSASVPRQFSTGSENSWDSRLFYIDQSKMIYAIGRTHQSYSTNDGKTWQNCGEDVTTSRSDSRLALDLQGSRLYLATPGQGVMISTDSCQSWLPSNSGLSNLFVNTLALDPNNPDIVYAGTDGGAYISYDAGATWGQINDGLLGATVVYSIAVDPEGNVYAATPYGIFKLEQK
jgi:photosystem II stability/assembly factor-like uncharacterized protein